MKTAVAIAAILGLALAALLAIPRAHSQAKGCTPIAVVQESVASEPSLRLVEMSDSEQKTALDLLHTIVNGIPKSANLVLMVEHSSGVGMFLIGENREICGRLIIGKADEWAKLKRGILRSKV